MKLTAKVALITGILLPISLAIFTGCNRGLLGFLRGENSYVTIHPNNSFDYNGTSTTDAYIVVLISSIFLGFYFFSLYKSTKHRSRREAIKTITIYVIYIVLIEYAIYAATYFVVAGRCSA